MYKEMNQINQHGRKRIIQMNNIITRLGLGNVMGVGSQGNLLPITKSQLSSSPYAQYAPTAIPSDPVKWMFDGEYCTINQFADKMWPNDCKEKTFFLIKYTGDTHG
jgi:hypothetical protein